MANIEIIKNFEGASFGTSHIKDNTIFSTFKEEPIVKKDGLTHDYNWHFVFGLKNNSKEPRTVEVFINCEDKDGLPHKANIMGQKSLDSDFFSLSDIEACTDAFKKYYLKMVLLGEETIYVSNTYFRNLKFVHSLLKKKGDQTPYVTTETYGKSVEGIDLTAYIYSKEGVSNNTKPTILISSGFHPMEADTLATEAIMEFLDTEEGKQLLNQFSFIIIPLVNPDGFSHGYNGCNTKGINLYWDFREKDLKNAPEAYYLWRFISDIQPSVYIDFHSYTFQLHRKHASPYIKPLFFYQGEKVKKLVSSINKELISLHDGHYMKGELTYTPSSLPYKLTKKFNTITYAKYHLHIMDGKEAYKKTAVQILKKITQCFIEENIHDKKQILVHPYGDINKEIKSGIKRKTKVFWVFKAKKILKQLIKKIIPLRKIQLK